MKAAQVRNIAFAATRDPNALSHRGGDLVVLVAFARSDQSDLSDLWFNPPTWVVTQPMLTSAWRVEPRRDGNLPAHFLALLGHAGSAP
jgi:hypothetical protein